MVFPAAICTILTCECAQFRIIQINFKTQEIVNLNGGKVQRKFKFTKVQTTEKDPRNPLAMTIFFRGYHPYVWSSLVFLLAWGCCAIRVSG